MLLDGKKVRNEILDKIKQEVIDNNYNLTLAIILIGNDAPSRVYVNNKIKYCDYVGISTKLIELDESTSEQEVIDIIEQLNKDKKITGMILQSPVPKQINIENCIKHISVEKDIDGFTKENFYLLAHNEEGIRPCTAKGIIRLLDYYNIDLKGKNVCIIGRGNLVGKPILFEMLNRDATVTICHSKTKDIIKYTKKADVIICGAGSPKILKKNMVKKNSIVVDAGITVIDNKVIGDADFNNLKNKCSYITPNPGGVGPMTIAIIIENIVNAYKKGGNENGRSIKKSIRKGTGETTE